jgi:hypothetical protein
LGKSLRNNPDKTNVNLTIHNRLLEIGILGACFFDGDYFDYKFSAVDDVKADKFVEALNGIPGFYAKVIDWEKDR